MDLHEHRQLPARPRHLLGQHPRQLLAIHRLDHEKLARVLAEEMARAGRQLPVFVQVNIGEEEQKAGIAPAEAVAFVEICRATYGLDVRGLMCIPPDGQPAGPYFAHLAQLGREAGVKALSMGMSGDFATAIAMGATHVRVGSALFGSRPPQAVGQR
ncbi:MAG: alanine racemase [Devosia sp.]